MRDYLAEVQSIELPNGCRVHSQQIDCSYEFMKFLFGSGAKDDPEGKEGLAHLCEHCMASPYVMDGTEFFESIGASNQFAATSYLNTQAHFQLIPENDFLATALNWYKKMFFETDVTKNRAQELAAIHGEYKKTHRNQCYVDWKLDTNNILFPGHRLARYVDALGTPETFQEVREEDLEAFYANHITPANLDIIAFGRLSQADLTEYLEKHFFPQRRAGERNVASFRYTPQIFAQPMMLQAKHSEHFKAKATRTEFRVECGIPGNHHYNAMMILLPMLKKVFFEELRHKREWSYGIQTQCFIAPEVTSISLEADDLPVEAASSIREVFGECLQKVFEREDLFRRYQTGQYRRILLDMEDSDCLKKIQKVQTYLYLEGRVISWAEALENYLKVTFDDIRALAPYFMPERRVEFQLLPE